tara:strand:- start:1778 stop:2119 length:342 start_codon:yes stop_codon:yes gene_type:complete
MFIKEYENKYGIKIEDDLINVFEELQDVVEKDPEEENFKENYEMDAIISDIPEIVNSLQHILDGKHHFYDFISCFLDHEEYTLKIRNPETFRTYRVVYDPKKIKVVSIGVEPI